MKMETVNVEGIKVRPGKPQHLAVGRVYAVTPEKAKALVQSKQAVKTDEKASNATLVPALGSEKEGKEGKRGKSKGSEKTVSDLTD